MTEPEVGRMTPTKMTPTPSPMPAPAATGDLNARIAERTRLLRAERGLTLDALADVSGVSRSMLSLIERGESNPTAAVLERLAAGLDVSLAALFDGPAATDPIARRADQPVWHDPASGYRRRNVSPPSPTRAVTIVEIDLPGTATVAFDDAGRLTALAHQIWVLTGSVEVTVGENVHRLATGDCLGFTLSGPVRYHNPTSDPARYAVVVGGGTGR